MSDGHPFDLVGIPMDEAVKLAKKQECVLQLRRRLIEIGMKPSELASLVGIDGKAIRAMLMGRLTRFSLPAVEAALSVFGETTSEGRYKALK